MPHERKKSHIVVYASVRCHLTSSIKPNLLFMQRTTIINMLRDAQTELGAINRNHATKSTNVFNIIYEYENEDFRERAEYLKELIIMLTTNLKEGGKYGN